MPCRCRKQKKLPLLWQLENPPACNEIKTNRPNMAPSLQHQTETNKPNMPLQNDTMIIPIWEDCRYSR